jgi:hypothetical protein
MGDRLTLNDSPGAVDGNDMPGNIADASVRCRSPRSKSRCIKVTCWEHIILRVR